MAIWERAKNYASVEETIYYSLNDWLDQMVAQGKIPTELGLRQSDIFKGANDIAADVNYYLEKVERI